MVEEGTNVGALACDVIIVTSIGTASPQKFTCYLKNLGVEILYRKVFETYTHNIRQKSHEGGKPQSTAGQIHSSSPKQNIMRIMLSNAAITLPNI